MVECPQLPHSTLLRDPFVLDMDAVTPRACPQQQVVRRGHSDEELKKLAGLNVLRVMRKTEAVAAKLQKERGPGEAIIEKK